MPSSDPTPADQVVQMNVRIPRTLREAIDARRARIGAGISRDKWVTRTLTEELNGDGMLASEDRRPVFDPEQPGALQAEGISLAVLGTAGVVLWVRYADGTERQWAPTGEVVAAVRGALP